MSLLREWENATGSAESNRGFFVSLLGSLEKHAPALLSLKTSRVFSARTVEETSELFSGRWPNSGILLDGVCLTAGTLESPNRVVESSLLGVIRTGKVPRRYFL